jgi:hypothetical protein
VGGSVISGYGVGGAGGDLSTVVTNNYGGTPIAPLTVPPAATNTGNGGAGSGARSGGGATNHNVVFGQAGANGIVILIY